MDMDGVLEQLRLEERLVDERGSRIKAAIATLEGLNGKATVTVARATPAKRRGGGAR